MSEYLKKKLLWDARGSAELRWHKLNKFKKTSNHTWLAACKHCAMWVQVDTNPPANGIDIGGPAVALNCEANDGIY
jgi:hypothetical protein